MRATTHIASAKALAQRFWFSSSAPAVTHRLGELYFRRSRPDEASTLDISQLRRVLIVRLDKIGDVVLSTPFLRELRRNMPRAEITLVVTPGAKRLVAACPYVDEVQTYDWRASRYLGPLHHLHTLAKARRDLWPRRFDLAIVPCWGVDYYLASFLAYFSGAPARLGYSEQVIDTKQRLNRGFDCLFTHLSRDRAVRHEVEHNVDLIRFMGGTVESDALELWIPESDEAFAAQLLEGHGVRPDDLLVAVAPGAGASKRRWPLERFAAVATSLGKTYGARIVLVGGRDDEALGRELAGTLGEHAIDLIGGTTLPRTAAVLRRCRLFIGNDSGPMHLAAAAGATVVEISCHPRSGSAQHENSPTRFGPWGKQHVVIQPADPVPPCALYCSALEPHCIGNVSVEDVRHAVRARLETSGVEPVVVVRAMGMSSPNVP